MTPPKRDPNRLGGRPTKCTPAFLDRLRLLLASGAHPRAAILSLGVSPDSHRRWDERGKAEPKTIYGEFCRVQEQASALARVAVGSKLFALARSGDIPAANAWLRHVKAEGFEPQNVIGVLHRELEDTDDVDAIRAEVDRKLAGVARALGT